jgi:uncharacterized phage-associated protein
MWKSENVEGANGMAGGTGYNEAKFHELIVYFAYRLGPEAALGHVKLMKLLMLADFTAFARTGDPITGATYEKWEHGHFPREWVMAEKDLEATNAIKQETIDYYGKKLHRVSAGRDPNMADFSEDELAISETILRRYGYESASYLSGLSHKELGWKLAKYKEEIPYETVFLGSGGVTAADVRRGEELASLHGWN